MSSASDEAILDEGRKRDAVVITLDADFHALLVISGASMPSVIRIRIEGMKGEQVASIIQRVQAVAASELAEGAAVTVTARRIAIRRLPITAK